MARRPGREHAEARLDPIRWRRPTRGALLRLGAIAALLLTAALVTWSSPQSCATPTAKPVLPTASKGTASSTSPAAADAGPSPGSRARMPAGTVGVPVRLAEPTALTLIRPGDHVDLLQVSPTHDTHAIAAAALVLGVTGADDPTAGGLLLALTPTEAAKAVAQPGGAFAVLIRP
jgi:hypothetical protein